MWYPPSLDAARFESLSRRIPLPRGVGLLGRVWETGRAAWVSDVTRDPDFQRAAAAAASGLRSALAFPIVIGADVIGVMEFFTRRLQQPDRDLLRALAVVGGQIGQFIERKEAEQERLRLLARERVPLVARVRGGAGTDHCSRRAGTCRPVRDRDRRARRLAAASRAGPGRD